VIKGIGKFVDSQGLPLQFVLDELNKNNCLIDWVDFIEYTIVKNWNITNTLTKIEEACTEVFGKDYSEQIQIRLRYYLIKRYDINMHL